MDPGATAAAFLELVRADDLIAWLGLPAGAGADAARQALHERRGFYQSMQANPKHRDVAKAFIKAYRELEAVLDDPPGHVAAMRERRAATHLPLLRMVIDGVLADGALSAEEAEFVRESAVALSVPEAVVDRLLREQAEARGIALSTPAPRAAPEGASTGSGMWSEQLAGALLDLVPVGARRGVDVAIGMGLTALTVLPDRPGLEILGLEGSAARLELARRALRAAPDGSRVALAEGGPGRIPVADGTVDVVLCVVSMHRLSESAALFREARRALAPGGRLVVAEPDRSAMRAWFDGPVPGFDGAWSALVDACEEAMGGGGADDLRRLGAGPMLVARMRAAGLEPVSVGVFPVVGCGTARVSDAVDHLATEIATLAAMAALNPRHPALRAANDALDRFESAMGSRSTGVHAHSVPLFVASARKP